jgi:hypothetical protein
MPSKMGSNLAATKQKVSFHFFFVSERYLLGERRAKCAKLMAKSSTEIYAVGRGEGATDCRDVPEK